MGAVGQGLPMARAFIPHDKSQGYASEPAIDWRGSFKASAVRAVAERSLNLMPNYQCTCEIWADEPTPKPRTFKQETMSEIVGYLSDWSSRANVSLSFQLSDGQYPLMYIWGALRDGSGAEPSDEVGVKLDRSLIQEGGGALVWLLFSETRSPAIHTGEFGEFLSHFYGHVAT